MLSDCSGRPLHINKTRDQTSSQLQKNARHQSPLAIAKYLSLRHLDLSRMCDRRGVCRILQRPLHSARGLNSRAAAGWLSVLRCVSFRRARGGQSPCGAELWVWLRHSTPRTTQDAAQARPFRQRWPVGGAGQRVARLCSVARRKGRRCAQVLRRHRKKRHGTRRREAAFDRDACAYTVGSEIRRYQRRRAVTLAVAATRHE